MSSRTPKGVAWRLRAAQELELRLGIAEGLLTDSEELRGRAKAKDAQCADVRRQMGEQRAAFEQQMASEKAQ
eukprot:2077727-Alexandrium_andersonii.AAC.1